MSAWEANERYEGIREAAREFALEQYRSTIFTGEHASLAVGLHFLAITEAALAAWDQGREHWNFPWDEIVAHFRKDTDRFEIAIWKGGELAGLGIGRPMDQTMSLFTSWKGAKITLS
jgi:hypothetical protein